MSRRAGMTPFIGVDIEEVGRFRALVRKSQFVQRVFTTHEHAYCAARKNKFQHFAVRFAAKEAVWKAVSDYLKRKKIHLSHRDIGIKNDQRGRPLVTLPRGLSGLERRIAVSLSHTDRYVVAMAVFTPASL